MLSEAHPELPIKGIYNPVTSITQTNSQQTLAQIKFTKGGFLQADF
jgi:hypothetical protein